MTKIVSGKTYREKQAEAARIKLLAIYLTTLLMFILALLIKGPPTHEMRQEPPQMSVTHPTLVPTRVEAENAVVGESAAPEVASAPEVAPEPESRLWGGFTDSVSYWEPLIVRWSEHYGVDPNLAAIIMQIESCGDPQAVSSAGAIGLFQVMPYHFAAGEDPYDPDVNAMRGIGYFKERLEQTGGDIGRSFAGYNGGQRAAASSWSQWPRETQRYYTYSTAILDDLWSGTEDAHGLQSWYNAYGRSLCNQAETRLGI